jgi:hypothetical protein
MHGRRRRFALGFAAMAVLTTAACGTSFATSPAGSSAAATSPAGSSAAIPSAGQSAATGSPGVYGAPADPSTEADPTDVVTDVPPPAEEGHDAVVFVTYADWNQDSQAVEEGSYVQGVVEDGGTCTLTLRKGGATAKATGPAEPDATNTSCGGLSVPAARLSSGTWSAVVSYESATTRGSSKPVEVTVP